MKKILISCFLFIAFCSSIQADTLKDKEAARELAKKVMEKIADGDTEGGVSLVKPYFIIPDHEFAGMLNSIRMQAPAIEQRFGKTIGTEFVALEEAGDSLMLIMYMQKFEKHVMRWKFYFYKPNDAWVLNTFNTDDQIQLMFKKY